MPSPRRTDVARRLARAAGRLADRVDAITFAPPVTHVYNPLRYAWRTHRRYLGRAPDHPRALFLGMNPGPWGMAQTGVPFGEIESVRDWIGIRGDVRKPDPEHPRRPIDGFACPRGEVSGRRLWGLFRQRFGTPEAFFADHFVANYCPLVFMEASGRNRTPDKLASAERRLLRDACDEHLRQVLEILRPRFAIGVGAFAEDCLRRVAGEIGPTGPPVTRILHPSPASPAANRDWAGVVTRQLTDSGVW